MNKNPDRWSGVRPAPVCVLVVLEVLMAAAKHLTVESYMVIYASNSYTYYY